jgi:hypothetical protein
MMPVLTSRHTYTENDGLEMPTTLTEGAIPVQEMPDWLISEPACICPSSNSSRVDEQNILDEHEVFATLFAPRGAPLRNDCHSALRQDAEAESQS